MKDKDYVFDTNDLAEFKGQIVDIFEDYFAEHNVVLNNEDKQTAIDDGEDPDNLAIIYGEDYDVIGDEIEYAINLKMSHGYVIDKSLMESISTATIDAAITLLANIDDETKRAEIILTMTNDKPALKNKIRDTFVNWNLYKS